MQVIFTLEWTEKALANKTLLFGDSLSALSSRIRQNRQDLTDHVATGTCRNPRYENGSKRVKETERKEIVEINVKLLKHTEVSVET